MVDPTSEPLDWRPIIAALAHAETRTVFAHVVLGHAPDLGATPRDVRRTEQCLTTLRRSGLLRSDDTVDEGALRQLLISSAPPKATGIERFLVDGRISQYPSNPTEREHLLRYVADEILQQDEVIDEAEMNRRLGAFHDDVAMLRRYLVDFELVERTTSGTQYALA